MRSRLRSGLRREDGLTLVELLVVLLIMVVVIGAIADLFVSGIRSETDQNARAQAQQDARGALDQMRREIHCATGVSQNPSTATWPVNAITITLGSWCDTSSGGAVASVTWCTTGSGPYSLYRYPHSTDYSGQLYSAACADTGSGGRLWVHDVVDASGVTGGKIFAGTVSGTLPSLAAAAISYGTSSGTLSSGTYAYVIDPYVSGVEEPGVESIITIPSGATNKSLLLDWTNACSAYANRANITKFLVYGRTYGAEQLLGTVSSTGCATTTFTDTNGTTPSGSSPVGASRNKLSVTLPIRADSSSIRLITLQDDMTLRNTPR